MKINPASLDNKDSHELMVCAIQPRPIALVSTIGPDGVYNVAPFSFFSGICAKPMVLGFSTQWTREGRKKDTLANIEYTQDFVINGVDEDLAVAMNKTSEAFPSDIDEFKMVGLTPVKADLVKPPMVAESPVNLECKLIEIRVYGTERPTAFIIGEVVQVHIKDEYYVSNLVPMAPWNTIGRMGEYLYCRTTDSFEMKSPSPLG